MILPHEDSPSVSMNIYVHNMRSFDLYMVLAHLLFLSKEEKHF